MRILTKMVIFLLVLGALSAFANVYMSGRAVRHTLTARIAETTVLRARENSAALATALPSREEKALLPLLRQLQAITGAAHVRLMDESGLTLAHTNVARYGKRDMDGFTRSALGSAQPVTSETAEGGGPALRISVPVFQAQEGSGDFLAEAGLVEKKRLGTLELLVPLRSARGTESALRRELFLINLVIAALIFLFSLVFFRRWVFQIRAVSSAVAEVGSGRYELSLPVLSNDELGDLTRQFNRMARTLSDTTVSKAFLDTAIENIPDPLFLTGMDGRVIKANRAASVMTGIPEKELVGKDALSMFVSGFGGVISPEELKKAGTLQLQDAWFTRDDKERKPVLFAAACIGGGASDGTLILTAKDLSESRKQQAYIKEAQENFRLLIESSPDAIFREFDGKFEYLNPAAVKLLGASDARELLGKECMQIVHPDYRAIVKQRFRVRHLEKREVPMIEEKLLKLDGTSFDALVSAVPIEKDGKPGGLVFFVDITDRKKAEGELLNLQKIESLGVMAGGIAHDFNNMLMGIMANLSLLEKRLGPGHVAAELLAETQHAADSAQALTRQLLTFAKGGKPLKKVLNLGTLLSESLAFAARGSLCRCTADIAADLELVSADAHQLKQVVNNLVINSVQAMPDGGEIRLTATNCALEMNNPHQLPPGRYVRIVLRDNGTGIPPKHLQKIFEPYFTTKAKGHGLGLAMVYSIIRNHGGHVTADSRLGEGTTFVMYLPASKDPRETEDATTGNAKGSGAPVGRILVMDDDAVVRRTVSRLLQALGHESVAVEDGQTALELYRSEAAKGRPFAAVIADLTVPGGMGGKEMSVLLRAHDPEARIIISSGYSDDPIMSDLHVYGVSAVLAKPYKIDELGAAISAVLTRKPGSPQPPAEPA